MPDRASNTKRLFQTMRLSKSKRSLVALCLTLAALAVLLTGGSPGNASQALSGGAPTATLNVPTPTWTLPPSPTATLSLNANPLPPGWTPKELDILKRLGNPSKAILVSVDQQVMHIYQNGVVINWSYVTTGRPALSTPKGVWHIYGQRHSTTFYSPWPKGSPYWYSPEHINYALAFRTGGFYLHDSTWRRYYGPGTNVWHQNPDGTWENGSHGCINVPLDFMQWLYNWAPLGTPVVVY